MTATKAKKGQLIVFALDHSYTSLKEGTRRYREFHVGLVAKTRRGGFVDKVEHGNCIRPLDQYAPRLIASTIEKPVAAVIADALRSEGYKTPDQARDAIKALLA